MAKMTTRAREQTPPVRVRYYGYPLYLKYSVVLNRSHFKMISFNPLQTGILLVIIRFKHPKVNKF